MPWFETTVIKRISAKGPASPGNGNGPAGNGKSDPAAQPADSTSAPIPLPPSSSPGLLSPNPSPIPPSNSGPSPSPSTLNSNPTPLNSSLSPSSSSYNSSPFLLSSTSSLISSTSNPAPSSSAVPLPDSCLGCIITMNNNASLHFNGIWSLNNISGSATRSTTTPNASIAFAFNGSSIAVFGTIPKSNATTKPPTTAYTVDADPPFVTTEPNADSDIPNQMLYRSSQLSSKEHVINITVENADAPYIIQYIFVFPPSNSTQNTQMSSSSSPASTSWNESESASDELSDIAEITKILGATLGSLFAFAIIVATIIIIRRRRLGRAKSSLTASWAPSFSASPRGLTSRVSDAFTTTASIMRSNASSVSYVEDN